MLSNKLSFGEESDSGFSAILRNYGNPGLATLQIKHRVRRLTLTKECFLGLQVDDCPARPGVCKECHRIKSSAAIYGQIATSSRAVSLVYVVAKAAVTMAKSHRASSE